LDGKKVYLQPMETVLNTVHDIVELLKGKPTVTDSHNGSVKTRLTMYGYKWDVHFTVADVGKNRSSVMIEVEGDRRDKKREISSMFALLDSMLIAEAEIELDENEDVGKAGAEPGSGEVKKKIFSR